MRDQLVDALARCLLGGEQAAAPTYGRASRMLGRRWRWLRPLALRYLEAFSGGTRPRHRDVTAFLKADAGLAQARAKHRREISVAEWVEEPPRMQSVEAARAWNIPEIETPGALAGWLGIEPGELDWFADLKGLGRTSPSLANLCARRVDCRLTGLAESAGAAYTRYADDLAFSGGEEFEQRVDRFSIHAAATLQEEGFAVQHHKTRIMRQSVRQHLAGLVTNQRVNVRRRDFDLLKATLTNCARLGPESQNREAHAHFRSHLEGRIAFVESIHREKGKKLREILARIEWPPSYN
jgi:hypothetical protein